VTNYQFTPAGSYTWKLLASYLISNPNTFRRKPMPPLARQLDYISVENYLAGERESEQKYEYVDGKMCAMAGQVPTIIVLLAICML
jgi:hypothetical protein